MSLSDLLADEQQVLYTMTALFSFLGVILAIVAAAVPTWSHFALDKMIGGVNTLIGIHWGPWNVCYNPNGGSEKCEAVTKKQVMPLDNGAQVVLLGQQWDFQGVQAVRAFGILMILSGVVVVAVAALVLFRINFPEILKSVARGLAFFSAFCGFVCTCMWASIADHNEEVYGSAFSVNIAAWMFFLFAGLTSTWQAADGIPAVVRKYIRPVTAVLVFALLIASTAHQAWSVTNYTDETFVFITVKVGLWTLCEHVAFHISGDPPSTECSKLNSSNIGDFDWSRVQGCQAMMVLAVLGMFLVLCGMVYGYVTQNYDHVIFKARIILAELTCLFSFITMCVWASMSTTSEYGTGFALNCGGWTLLLLWLVFEIRVERGSSDGGTSVGYSMAT